MPFSVDFFQEMLLEAVRTLKKEPDDSENTIILVGQVSDKILDFYNEIVISGYYINPVYSVALKWISDNVDELRSLLFGQSYQVEDQINKLADVVCEANNLLRILHKRTCSNERGRNYLSEYSHLNKFENKFSSFKTNGYILFIQNVKLAFFDHFLAVKTEQLEKLFQVKESISSSDYRESPFTEILLDKCNYLIYKVLFRLTKDENSYSYLSDDIDNVVDINSIRKEVKIFNSFLGITDSHYSDQFNSSQPWINPLVSQKGKNVSRKLLSGEKLSFEEYHTLIKFSKDINHNRNEISRVKNKFFDTPLTKGGTDEFDALAFSVDKNYIFNNIISSAIENKESLKAVRAILTEIIKLQEETEIRNYFPFFKMAEFYKTTIEQSLNTLADTEYKKLDEIESWILDYKHVINQCYQTFKWCSDRNYTAFQLPFDECKKVSEIAGEDKGVFLSSSFVLPLNYTEIETQLSKIDRDYNRVKTQIALYKTVKKERLEIEGIKDLLTREVLDRDRKQIEILGIFAAIVLFSASEVQLFVKIQSVTEAIMFSLSFAYSLGTFVIVVWLITRNYKIQLTLLHWFFVVFFIAATGIIYWTLIGWELLKGLTLKL